MELCRKYGTSPFRLAMLHGGPGAAGEMAPVARELSATYGVLEPLQSAYSIEGQVGELGRVLGRHSFLPVTLLGFSWGAWLGLIFAAAYPAAVRKLILVGSPPFEADYAAGILETRLSRMNGEERAEVRSLFEVLENPSSRGKQEAFGRLGELFERTDAFDPLPIPPGTIDADVALFRSVWEEARALRTSGEILKIAAYLKCPVVAIHGDADPHPPAGVGTPLPRVVRDFRFILIQQCGHRPWIERQASEKFYAVLREELPPDASLRDVSTDRPQAGP